MRGNERKRTTTYEDFDLFDTCNATYVSLLQRFITVSTCKFLSNLYIEFVTEYCIYSDGITFQSLTNFYLRKMLLIPRELLAYF